MMADLRNVCGIVLLFLLKGYANAAQVAFSLPPPGTSLEIAQDTATDTYLEITILASDVQSYSFSSSPDDGTFTGETSFPNYKIKVAQTPSATEYSLTVTAHGSDGSTATRVITVTVVQAGNPNDHAPVFQPISGPVKIVEDASTGSSVVTVTANDADTTSPENEITYSLGGPTFAINSTTGLITLSASLDYTTLSSYELEVTATDGATAAKSATLTVTVSIQTRPVWTHSGSLSETIPEDTPTGTEISTLEATDEDDSGSLQYSIITQTSMFTVDNDKVKSAKLLDVDAQGATQTYTLILRVSDGTYNAASDVTLQIAVTDVNDSPPVFDPSEIQVSCAEYESDGNYLYTATATDADYTSQNNVITYSLQGQDSLAFDINSISGEIRVKDAVKRDDYCVNNSVLTVIATDSGSPENIASLTIKFLPNDSIKVGVHVLTTHGLLAVACLLILGMK